ncbi:MAG: alpha/beta hydrolase [Actinobacteria bacterium]|nr:alpha/beta hydrolase [Actinomycetota bacterium]MBU1945144.1 alpha/beta hydrolase [Actinomycetota bacterium]MBU2686406.1 alpha/beta hydrolase [Actinomycetota bacterium]
MEKTELVRIGNVDLAYRVRGKGFPVLLIMGLTADMDWWPPSFVKGLSSSYRVVMFDNRGSGRSHAGGLGPFSIEEFAKDTAGLMRNLGMKRAHVIGLSMGGMIAQQLTLDCPDMVDHLVLSSTSCGVLRSRPPRLDVYLNAINPLGGRTERARRILAMLFSDRFRKANSDVIADLERRYFIAPTNDYNAVRQLIAALRFDCCHRLSEVQSPTLVIRGDSDDIFPGRDADLIAGRIPCSKLVVMKDAGHVVMNQYPEKCLDIILDFLQQAPEAE